MWTRVIIDCHRKFALDTTATFLTSFCLVPPGPLTAARLAASSAVDPPNPYLHTCIAHVHSSLRMVFVLRAESPLSSPRRDLWPGGSRTKDLPSSSDAPQIGTVTASKASLERGETDVDALIDSRSTPLQRFWWHRLFSLVLLFLGAEERGRCQRENDKRDFRSKCLSLLYYLKEDAWKFLWRDGDTGEGGGKKKEFTVYLKEHETIRMSYFCCAGQRKNTIPQRCTKILLSN